MIWVFIISKSTFQEDFSRGVWAGERNGWHPCTSPSTEGSVRQGKPRAIFRKRWNCSLPQTFTSRPSALNEVLITWNVQTGMIYTLGHHVLSQYFSSLSERQNPPKGLVKTHLPWFHTEGFWFRRSGARPENSGFGKFPDKPHFENHHPTDLYLPHLPAQNLD